MMFNSMAMNDNSLLYNIVFIAIIILIAAYLIYTRNVDK